MPLLIPLVVALFIIVALPLSLVQRYRAGTARRLGRRWVVTLNLGHAGPLGCGFPLGRSNNRVFGSKRLPVFLLRSHEWRSPGPLGLALTRWEATPRETYYTPNRWLILVITLAVTMRLIYGLWRIWHAWRTTGSDTSWVASAGVAGSMAVGAVVLGYYLAYSAGVRWRLRRL